MFPKSINIGPLNIHFYGLIIATSIYLGWLLAKKRANLYKIPKKIFDDPILLIPLILAIVGARTYHVLDLWDFYSKNPGQILALSGGGLGIWGALVGIILGFIIVTKVKKLDLLSTLDLLAPSLLLGQALGRFGNFVNQEAFGPPTEKPWGIFISPENRPAQFINFAHFHPTFFYEAAVNGLFFIILLFLAQKLKFKGQLFALYLIFYSAGRFIVEFWRIDTWIVGTVRVAHVLSITAFIIGIWIYLKKNKVLDKN